MGSQLCPPPAKHSITTQCRGGSVLVCRASGRTMSCLGPLAYRLHCVTCRLQSWSPHAAHQGTGCVVWPLTSPLSWSSAPQGCGHGVLRGSLQHRVRKRIGRAGHSRITPDLSWGVHAEMSQDTIASPWRDIRQDLDPRRAWEA